jgi:uncharacterized protein YqeY
LNHRPPGPEPGALARLRYAPTKRTQARQRKRPEWNVQNSIALRLSLELAVVASSRARITIGLTLQDESFSELPRRGRSAEGCRAYVIVKFAKQKFSALGNRFHESGETRTIVRAYKMALMERIQKDLTAAMMSKDELRLSVLRMIKSALKYKEIEKVRALEDAEALQVLQTLVKQRRESVEQFGKGGRQDLVDKESKEIVILEAYLPAGASDAEMSAAIEAAIVETGANSPKSMGAVIKAAKARLEGKTVDGKILSDRVRERLSKMA